MTFTHRLRVRYGEVDMQGVVFNAHWLSYFDDAMTRFFENLGFPPETFLVGGSFDAMLVASSQEFRGPVRFDDEVALEVVPSRIGTSSFDLAFTARVDGEVVVTGTSTYVSIDDTHERSTPIPDEVRAALAGAAAPTDDRP